MVATLSRLTDPAAAAAYYEADDYYTGDAKAPSRWHGRGAEALGLQGEVDSDTFAAMLEGKLPDGTVLGTTRNGAREHKLGWDLTFSAPKSVSVLALVAGDKRLLNAHDKAVARALDYAERHAAVTRVRGGAEIQRVATGNLAVATFPHFTARAVQSQQPAPQVHTHSVILNASRRADGEWRSLESQPLYKLQKSIGSIYHQELAAEARQLGYAVTVAADGTFELAGVEMEVRQGFSARAAQIEAALATRGQTRATASAAEKAIIALDTRAPKEQVDHSVLAAAWRAQADQLGFDEVTRRRIVAEAEARALEQPTLDSAERRFAADQAVAFASAKIAEREAVFSCATLECEAGDATRGTATNADIVAAIERAQQRQALVMRAAPRAAKGMTGYATREGVATEQRMLAIEAEGRNACAALHDRIGAARSVAAAELASPRGHAWTEGQRAATKGLLTSTSAVTGIQGSAGTAKTTTVLRHYAKAAREQGLSVRALAPTATAAAELGRAIGAEPRTVAKLLRQAGDDIKRGREAWIVDEASMLSARDAERLLARARKAEARLVLVGDVAQLASVEAGRAFGQLQDHGMPTLILDQIVRQTNVHTREAVEAMLAGDAEKAFAALDAGGGAIIEHDEDDIRHAIIARDFAKLSSEDRAETLVLDPTREGRQRLTDAIRAALIRDGTLGEEAMTAVVLEPCGLTRAEAARAASYQPGCIVTFRKGAKLQPRPGIGYRIEAVDAETGTVRLLDPKGKAVAWQPARWGADQAEAFTEVEQEFRAGDRLQFTRNHYRAGRLNGATATVVAVDAERSSLVIEKQSGEQQSLNLAHLADRHVRPGWVKTIHSSQGATADRVMAHLESFRANTVDARAAYVAISRARTEATLYTDSRERLLDAIDLRDGAQVGAIDEVLEKEQRCGMERLVRAMGIGLGG
jgi:conjugative relaxase-like TrwC/TraI family protein